MSLLEIREVTAPASVIDVVQRHQNTDAQIQSVVRASLDVLGAFDFVGRELEPQLVEQFDQLMPYVPDEVLPAVGINLRVTALHPHQLMSAFNEADVSRPRLYVDEVYTYPALQAQDWDMRGIKQDDAVPQSLLFAMAISPPLGERLDWTAQHELQQQLVASPNEYIMTAALTQADWVLYNAAARRANGSLPALDDMDNRRTFTRFVQYPLQPNGQGFSADISDGEAGLGDSIPSGLPGGSFRVVYYQKA